MKELVPYVKTHSKTSVVDLYNQFKIALKEEDVEWFSKKMDVIEEEFKLTLIVFKILDKVLANSKYLGIRRLIVKAIKAIADTEADAAEALILLSYIYPSQFGKMIRIEKK